MLTTMNEARQRSPLTAAGQLEPEVEAAYSELREAFEAWIQLTALDTASAAIESHEGDETDEEE
jgi:hypothetical protein